MIFVQQLCGQTSAPMRPNHWDRWHTIWHTISILILQTNNWMKNISAKSSLLMMLADHDRSIETIERRLETGDWDQRQERRLTRDKLKQRTQPNETKLTDSCMRSAIELISRPEFANTLIMRRNFCINICFIHTNCLTIS